MSSNPSAETVNRLIHLLSGGDHQPHHPGRSELSGEYGQRIGTDPAPFSHALYALRVGIIPHHPMATLHQTRGHVRAHSAQTDHTDLHGRTARPYTSTPARLRPSRSCAG